MTIKIKNEEVQKDLKEIEETIKIDDDVIKINTIEYIASKYMKYIPTIGNRISHSSGSMAGDIDEDLEIRNMDLELLKSKLELFMKDNEE